MLPTGRQAHALSAHTMRGLAARRGKVAPMQATRCYQRKLHGKLRVVHLLPPGAICHSAYGIETVTGRCHDPDLPAETATRRADGIFDAPGFTGRCNAASK